MDKNSLHKYISSIESKNYELKQNNETLKQNNETLESGLIDILRYLNLDKFKDDKTVNKDDIIFRVQEIKQRLI